MLIAYVPNKYFGTFLTLLYEIDQQISKYIEGQLIDSLIVGILTIIGLYWMGIRYAFFIGVVLGIVNINTLFWSFNRARIRRFACAHRHRFHYSPS